MQLKILYEDNHLLALEKDSGLPTQPSENSKDSLEEQAKAFIKERDQKKAGVFLHAVHRLDKEASGIVLFAKTQKALSRLSEAFREHSCEKTYLALIPEKPLLSGLLKDYLFHDDHKATVVSKAHPKAKEAVLTILSRQEKELRGTGTVILLTISLHTGRYHQIRAQLSAHGCPIIGDTKYGSPFKNQSGIFLHHSKLSFPHPTKEEKITITSTPAWA